MGPTPKPPEECSDLTPHLAPTTLKGHMGPMTGQSGESERAVHGVPTASKYCMPTTSAGPVPEHKNEKAIEMVSTSQFRRVESKI